MRARTGLPLALSRFGLLQAGKAWESIRRVKPIGTPCTREGATEQEPEPAP
jgi:hypothetical protein